MKRFLFSLLASLLLSSCGNDPQTSVKRVLPLSESSELVVLVPNGPTTLYIDAQGRYAGFEYDLVSRFAEQNNLQLRFDVVNNYAELQDRLQRHEAHMAVGLTRELIGTRFQSGPVYQAAEPVLVYRGALSQSESKAALRNGSAMVSVLPQFLWALPALRQRYPALNAEVVERENGEFLAERVARGEVSFALVDRHTAEIVSNAYPTLAYLDDVAPAGHLAWALVDGESRLAGQVAQFFAKSTKDGTIARLADRYYGHLDRLDEPDTLAFLGKSQTVLPRFRSWFQEAEVQTGMDWRLIAALAYQESHWDPQATSGYGVRGMMMLTTDTALHLGVDRLDPYQSILGGARYIQELKQRIPQRIAEPDRTWLALAAYNVGLAHLEDARVLAGRQKKNPDSWADLKTTLPLLSKPEFFETVKFGYARGGEPVIFVESLRAYYDILVRREKPLKVTLPQISGPVRSVSPVEPQAASRPDSFWLLQARAD